MIPSNFAATKVIPGSSTASANFWSCTQTPATSTASVEQNPESEPDPYCKIFLSFQYFGCIHLNSELLPVSFPGSRRLRIIFSMKKTSNIRKLAFRRWNPQIGRSSIEDHRKFLRRSSDVNCTVILSVHVVCYRLTVAIAKEFMLPWKKKLKRTFNLIQHTVY